VGLQQGDIQVKRGRLGRCWACPHLAPPGLFKSARSVSAPWLSVGLPCRVTLLSEGQSLSALKEHLWALVKLTTTPVLQPSPLAPLLPPQACWQGPVQTCVEGWEESLASS
jgi:hypothetical protein